MKRRGLLTAFGTAIASAGCLTPSGGPDDASTETGTPTHSGTRTDTGTPASEIPPASGEFDGVACSGDTDADRTVCYHTATGGDDVVLAAHPEVFAPDTDDDTVEDLRFTLYNHSEWTVLVNPYDWAIHRRDGSSWTRVAPSGARNDPLYILEPGQTLEWALPETTHPSPGGDDTYRVDTSLAAGTYAFSVTGTYGGTNLTETPTGEPPAKTAFVALFRLESAVGGGEGAPTAGE